MVQVKKPTVRDAILSSAFTLFAARGYAGTTLAAVAADADITTTNIYRYFDSKFELLYAVFDPWLMRHLDGLERRVQTIAEPRARMRAILLALWRDIPRADGNFALNLIQALALKRPDEPYSRALLETSKQRIATMMRGCLPPEAAASIDDNVVTHLMFMAYDGFAMNAGLGATKPSVEAVAESFCDLLFRR